MLSVALRGAGAVGVFGAGLADLQLWLDTELERGPKKPAMQRHTQQPVSTEALYQFVAKSSLRRTDHFCQLALTALFYALDDAGLTPKECENSALLLATGYGPVASTCGFKNSFLDNGPLGASPTMFTKSVQNQAAAHIAMHLGLHGPVATVCQHTFPFHMALQTGCLWLKEDRADRIIIGGVDEYDPFLNYCRKRFLASPQDVPLAKLGDPKVVPGEGAGFFIFERDGSLQAHARLHIPPAGVRPSAREKGVRLVGGSGADAALAGSLAVKGSSALCLRNLYGDFPAAGALDLASLVVLMDRYGEGMCEELSKDGQSTWLHLQP